MYTFPIFLKKIRESSGLSQKQLANVLDVSTVLIAMVETNQKPPSKNLVIKLAGRMGVRPTSITPFIVDYEELNSKPLSRIEKSLEKLVEELQIKIIERNAPKLGRYGSKYIPQNIHKK